MRRSLVAVLIGASVCLAACSDDPGTAIDPGDDVEVLSPGEGCGDAFFWATNPDDTIAFAVMVDQRDRSQTEPTSASYDVGDEGLTVTVLRGHDLSGTFCTDVIVNDPIDSEDPATAGHVAVELDPLEPDFQGCGSTTGTATITGLEGDGVSFADVTVESANIGCYAG
jgi:hypothetical protein